MTQIDVSNLHEEKYPAYGPDSAPFGVTYGEWTARWWKWALSLPKENNPVTDPNGRNGHLGQVYDPVWFLAGTFVPADGKVERTCKIPSGKAILFPVSNHESSFKEFPHLRTELELRECSKEDIDKVTTLVVSIDGVGLREADLKSYRIRSPAFDLVLPKNNVLAVLPGKTKAVSDGYWVFLKPLPEGRHDIFFMGSCLTDELKSEVLYHISVSR